jgi:hypothetical protein
VARILAITILGFEAMPPLDHRLAVRRGAPGPPDDERVESNLESGSQIRVREEDPQLREDCPSPRVVLRRPPSNTTAGEAASPPAPTV